MEKLTNFIAVMDSGVGGVSVLAEAKKLLPEENFLFFADAENAPYGDKASSEIADILIRRVDKFCAEGAKAVLLACNTATSAAAEQLRRRFDIPILGMEPALKPAVENVSGQIAVLGTQLTMREQKFQTLMKKYAEGRDIVPIPCPGLMEIVEQNPRGEKAENYLMDVLEPYWESVRAVVLGCTHYVFLRPILEWMLPAARIFDGNNGVCNHLRDVLTEKSLLGGEGLLRWDCSLSAPSARERYLEKCHNLYQQALTDESTK